METRILVGDETVRILRKQRDGEPLTDEETTRLISIKTDLSQRIDRARKEGFTEVVLRNPVSGQAITMPIPKVRKR